MNPGVWSEAEVAPSFRARSVWVVPGIRPAVEPCTACAGALNASWEANMRARASRLLVETCASGCLLSAALSWLLARVPPFTGAATLFLLDRTELDQEARGRLAIKDISLCRRVYQEV